MHGKSKHMEMILMFFRDTLSILCFLSSGFVIFLSCTQLFPFIFNFCSFLRIFTLRGVSSTILNNDFLFNDIIQFIL